MKNPRIQLMLAVASFCESLATYDPATSLATVVGDFKSRYVVGTHAASKER